MKKIVFISLLCLAFVLNAQQSLQWANAFNGNSSATGSGYAVTTDAFGNVYTVGNFSGTMDFDPSAGTNTIISVGATDAFLSKYDANGNLIWVKTFGGIGSNALAKSIKVSTGGNIHISGWFTSSVDFDPNLGVLNLTSNGLNDVFILKLDATGNLLWAKNVGSTGDDLCYGMDVDAIGNVYTTGSFFGTVDFNPNIGVSTLTAAGYPSPSAGSDIFVLRLNLSGNFVWAYNFGDVNQDAGRAIHLDNSNGYLWITGYFRGTADFDPSGSVYNITSNLNTGAFNLKLDFSGNFYNAGTFSGIGYAQGEGIIFNSLGEVYITGSYDNIVDFDPSGSNFDLTTNGILDIFVVKLSNNGNLIWAKSIGGSGVDIGQSISLDTEENVFLAGRFQNTCDFDPDVTVYNLISAGDYDGFICKLNNSGSFLCAGSMGGIGLEYAYSISLDVNNNMLITGSIASISDFDPSAGVYNVTPIGVTEPFIAKYQTILPLTTTTNSICDGTSITLFGSGAITYSWVPATGLNTTTSATVIATPSVNTTYTVFGKTACVITASPKIINLLSKPSFSTPNNPQKLYCVPDSVLLQSISTNTNVSFKWRKSVNATYTNQPYYAKTSGNYFSIATDVSNSCSDSSLISVLNFQNYPNSKIISHTYIGPTTAIDTVTCYQPIVTLNGGSDTNNVNISWKNTITNSISSNPINLITQSNLKLVVTNTINGCTDSTLLVLVAQNNAPITYSLSANVYSINCSYYTATLNAIGTQISNVTFWSGPSFTNQTNPYIVSGIGNYTISSTNTLSGCANTKTVEVVLSNKLILKSSNDTLVCKNANISITSSAIGTVTGITYSWSNGSNNQTNSINANNTSTYIVNASGSGCNGVDTVIVNVAPLTNDSVVAYKSCSNPIVGSIVIFANSGIAPFQYSINNGLTYSATNSFTNLAFGNYTTTVKDGLGCIKINTITLNAFSNLPVPKFIASTLNFQNDTIVLVDISVPKPDSVQWLLPVNAIKIGGTMFSPVIVVSDTGSFNITMKAFYGNCIINTTKQIKFGKTDTLSANNYNTNGIKSVILYPNPNDGLFTVDVELHKKQNVSLQVLSSSGAQQLQQNFYETNFFSLPVNLTQLVNGTYILRIIGEYDLRTISFIINK